MSECKDEGCEDCESCEDCEICEDCESEEPSKIVPLTLKEARQVKRASNYLSGKPDASAVGTVEGMIEQAESESLKHVLKTLLDVRKEKIATARKEAATRTSC